MVRQAGHYPDDSDYASYAMARVAKLFQSESAKAGRKLELGQRIGVLRQY